MLCSANLLLKTTHEPVNEICSYKVWQLTTIKLLLFQKLPLYNVVSKLHYIQYYSLFKEIRNPNYFYQLASVKNYHLYHHTVFVNYIQI